MHTPSPQPRDTSQREQDQAGTQPLREGALKTEREEEFSRQSHQLSAHHILLTAALRQRLQTSYPNWSVTPHQRDVVDHFSTARIAHEHALLEPERAAQAVIQEERGLELFSRSVGNLARATRSEPLQSTGGVDLTPHAISTDSPSYQNEVVGTLWAVQSAVFLYRDNASLFSGLLKTLQQNLHETSTMFHDEAIFHHVMFSILRAGSHPVAREQLLQAKWLGIEESDLPSLQG